MYGILELFLCALEKNDSDERYTDLFLFCVSFIWLVNLLDLLGSQ